MLTFHCSEAESVWNLLEEFWVCGSWPQHSHIFIFFGYLQKNDISWGNVWKITQQTPGLQFPLTCLSPHSGGLQRNGDKKWQLPFKKCSLQQQHKKKESHSYHIARWRERSVCVCLCVWIGCVNGGLVLILETSRSIYFPPQIGPIETSPEIAPCRRWPARRGLGGYYNNGRGLVGFRKRLWFGLK